MHRLDHRPWAFWFLVLLLAPAILSLAGRYPNNVFADTGRPPGPGFDTSRLLDEEYYREVDQLATNTLSIHGAGLWARSMVDYDLFGDTGTDEVIAGADGWLYWAPYLTLPCDELAALAIPRTPRVSGNRLRVVITVPKAAIHPEPLASIRPCEVEARRAWRASMENDRRYLDVNVALERARERNPDEDLFYRRDTHWSPAGRRLVAARIVNALQSDVWDWDALVPVEGDPVPEELLRLVGRRSTVTRRDWEVHRSVEPVVVTDLPYGATDLLGVYETTMEGDDPVVAGTTLIVGDSQMNHLVPYLAPYFEHMVFVQLGYVQLGYDLSQHRPDRVIVESIESGAGRLTPALMERMAAAIVAEDGGGA